MISLNPSNFTTCIIITILISIYLYQVLVVTHQIFAAVHGLLSSRGAWAPEHVDSEVAAHGVSSCGALA